MTKTNGTDEFAGQVRFALTSGRGHKKRRDAEGAEFPRMIKRTIAIDAVSVTQWYIANPGQLAIALTPGYDGATNRE